MKRFNLFSAILAVVLVVSMCILPAAATVAQATESKTACFRGDVNNNGEIEKYDYILVKRYIMKTVTFTDEQLVGGDVNANGELEKFDYILIKRHVMKTYTIEEKHNVISVAAKDATCTEKGNIAYFACANCGKCFSDAAAKNEITLESTVVPVDATAHDLEFHTANDATCTENGNAAYYSCNDCQKLFTDAEAQYEITVENTVINASHKWTTVEGYAPTYEKEGLTSGIQCSVCKDWKEEQEPIPVLPPVEHNITFYDEKTPGYPKYETYVEHLGLDSLPSLEKEGYKFLGWYNAVEGGEKVVFVPKNSKEDLLLYAHWEAIVYSITYFEAPKNENKLTYTVEDEFYLTNPEWSGLSFTGWTDEEGKLLISNENGAYRAKLNKGTTGDFELTANWKRLRNIATPAVGDRKLASVYDEKEEIYYFIYELGAIEHVILDQIATGEYKYKEQDYSLSISETVSIGEEYAKSITTTVTNSVTKTEAWEDTVSWAKNASKSFEIGGSVGVEVAIPVVKTKLATDFGITGIEGSEWGDTHTKSGDNGWEHTTEDCSSSSITYKKELTKNITKDITISAGMPEGYYYYVHAANIRVFAIVAFDPATENYSLHTYSLLDNMHAIPLYYRNANDINDNSSEGLSFDVPVDDIKTQVDSCYYIQYNANGGEGTMLMSSMSVDKEDRLATNQFTKEGYTFLGWKYTTAEGVVILPDTATVKNLANAGETVTLIAEWAANQYVATFDANGGTVDKASITVSYDSTYGVLPIPERTGYTFNGWLLNSDLVSADTVVKSLNDHTLVASWTANKYTVTFDADGGAVNPSSKEVTFDKAYGTLPAPTKKGYLFVAWTLNAEPITADMVMKTAKDHTLVATWKENEYTVNYNPNGGTGTTKDSDHKYDVESKLTSNGFTRHGWTFLGWSKDPNATSATYSNGQSVKNLTETKDTVVLYAVWRLNTRESYTRSNFYVSKNQGDSNHSVNWSFNTRNNFDIDYLINNGYKIRISVSYYAEHQGNDGYIINYLWNGGSWYKKYQPEFDSSLSASWSFEATADFSSFTIEFTSGKVWNWDCTSYNVVNPLVTIEFFK